MTGLVAARALPLANAPAAIAAADASAAKDTSVLRLIGRKLAKSRVPGDQLGRWIISVGAGGAGLSSALARA
jgi:hypothetical protein